jgi:hypothetical protein
MVVGCENNRLGLCYACYPVHLDGPAICCIFSRLTNGMKLNPSGKTSGPDCSVSIRNELSGIFLFKTPLTLKSVDMELH